MNSASLILDFIATFAFALVGAQMAIRKGMDVAGLVFVSSVSALSGGTFRNIVLGIPPAWLDHAYLLVAVLVSAVIAVALKKWRALSKFSLFFDSIGLGFATTAGVQVSLDHGSRIYAALVLGILSGVLGGLVRDVLCQVPPVLLHRETNGISSFIAAAAFAWLHSTKITLGWAEGISIALLVLLRLVSVKFKWNLPRF